MKNIDIIVMGKTGAGKSTLINTILEEDLAPTGIGQPITKKNVVYSKQMLLPVGTYSNNQYGMVGCTLNMYDTVGLEIDNSITDKTLDEIRKHIEETKSKMNFNDIHLVWFCVNNASSRFESYELNLIRKLSIDYEIPFVIVLTQCFSDEEGELETKIKNNLPEVPRSRVLAKDYLTRGGKIKAYGILELLQKSVSEYKNLKVDILERKLNELDESREERIKKIERKANDIITDYSDRATKIGFVPTICIPIVHGMCIKMVAEINKLAGFESGHNFAEEIFKDFILGVITVPLMMFPLISAATACAYVQTVGEEYLEAVISVIHLSADYELGNNEIVKQRLKKELTKLKKQ